MKIEYTLAMRDYRAALKLHRRQRLSRRLIYWLAPLLLLVALAGLVAASINRNLQWAENCLSFAGAAIVLTIGFPILRAVSARKSFKRLFPSGDHDRRSSLDINDDRIVREHVGASELKVPWSGVFGFAQDEKITMIYTNKDCFLLFPTRIMSPDQRAELSDLIARRVVKR